MVNMLTIKYEDIYSQEDREFLILVYRPPNYPTLRL